MGRGQLIDHAIIKDIADNQLALSADELAIQQGQHHALHDIARATGEKGPNRLAPIAAAPASTPPPAVSATPLLDETDASLVCAGLAILFGIVPA